MEESMDQIKFTRKLKIFFMVILISILGVVVIKQAFAFSSYDIGSTQSIFVPPTPDIDTLSRSEQPIQALPQREISRIIDLVKELPGEDIFVFIVQRADGRYEEYRISATYSGDVMELMQIASGDKIITGYPLKPMISTPVIETPVSNKQNIEASPLGDPYPHPLNIEPATPILQPYP
jgi:hypothetical protein